jgi:hypothetical protein
MVASQKMESRRTKWVVEFQARDGAVHRSVDRRVIIRFLQGAMDISVTMEQLSYAT